MNLSKLFPALMLTLFAAVGVGLITLADVLTYEHRLAEQKAALTKLLYAVAPIRSGKPARREIQTSADNHTIRSVYTFTDKDIVSGYAVQFTAPHGYNGPIILLVGLNTQFEISGIRVIKHRETPGLGDRIEAVKSNWLTGFEGLSVGNEPQSWKLQKHGGSFDNLSGATVTARAILNAVRDNLNYLHRHPGLLSPEQP